jgi:hypothetical protein
MITYKTATERRGACVVRYEILDRAIAKAKSGAFKTKLENVCDSKYHLSSTKKLKCELRQGVRRRHAELWQRKRLTPSKCRAQYP